jgi:hypothetical protein
MQDAMLQIAISSCERAMRPHKKINTYSFQDPSMIYCALHELASARGVFLLPVHEKKSQPHFAIEAEMFSFRACVAESRQSEEKSTCRFYQK